MATTYTDFTTRLQQRQLLLGTLLTLPSPDIAEICAAAGFDWLFIDMEHGLLDFEAAQRMIQAASPCPCIVRVPASEPIWIAKALDTGAAGVIVPHVNTASEAAAAVRAGKFAPAGTRSLGVARAQGFGAQVTQSIANANAETVVIAQAEHIEAARHVEAIAAVPGLGAIFIGPFDLSASLGKPGQITDPDVQEAIASIRDTCAAARIPCGIFVVEPAAARGAFAEGYSLVCVSTDTMLLTRTAAEVVRESRARQAL